MTSRSLRTQRFSASDATQILKEAGFGLASLKRFFLAEEEVTLCDLYAAPFIHGPSLAPEIGRLQSHINYFPDAAALEQAHAQLFQIKEELPSISPLLECLRDAELCTQDLYDLVCSYTEADVEGRRLRLVDDARGDAERGRAAFEEKITARIRAADEAASSMMAEATSNGKVRGAPRRTTTT